MKKVLVGCAVMGLLVPAVFGQGAQADQVKRRAKETANQNNVRQGVPSPAQTQPRPAAPAVAPAAPAAHQSGSSVTQVQTLAALKNDLGKFKSGSTPTAEQKQLFSVHLTQAARGKKPSSVTVQKLVDSLTAALAEASLTSEQQVRLAQNLDGVFNAKSFSATNFEKLISDTQAILEVGSVKRATAVAVAADLKAVGAEIRR